MPAIHFLSLPKQVQNLARVWRGKLRWTRPVPLPNFLDEPIELEQVRIADIDRWGRETLGPTEYLPCFVNYPPAIALQNGWVRTIREYQSFAALVFAYQYPAHPYSRFVRTLYPYLTDSDLSIIIVNK